MAPRMREHTTARESKLLVMMNRGAHVRADLGQGRAHVCACVNAPRACVLPREALWALASSALVTPGLGLTTLS